MDVLFKWFEGKRNPSSWTGNYILNNFTKRTIFGYNYKKGLFMKQFEIIKKFDIPSSTLKDWSQEDDRRNSLYQFLRKITPEEFEQINSRQKVVKKRKQPSYHRILHIVNRNTGKKHTLPDIVKAFSENKEYANKSIEEKLILDRFFKECDEDDFKKLLLINGIKKTAIKKVYLKSPSSRSPFHKQWDKVLHVKNATIADGSGKIDASKSAGIAAIEKLRASRA